VSPSKSFWSGIPVVAKAVGGIGTGIVGIGGLLVALGVIGNSNNTSPTVTTVPSSDGTSVTTRGGGSPTSSTAKGSFTVDPTTLTFGLGKADTSATVVNNGSVALKMNTPDISGDSDKFSVSATECTSKPLAPKKSCSIDVKFTGALSATATVVVSADNAPDTVTVTLKGSSLGTG